MRQIYYTFLTLLRGRGSNVIKTISLTLGLFISVLLFAQIAFERSFDSHFDGIDQIYKIQSETYSEGKGPSADPWMPAPFVGAFTEELPQEIECGTLCRNLGTQNVFYNDRRMRSLTTLADTMYFRTLGIEVVTGDPRELTNPDVLFISEEYARENLGKDLPVGEIVMYNKTIPLTVKGVYRTIPDNSTIHPDVVVSLATAFKVGMLHWSWEGGSAFEGYLRLRKGVDPDKLESRLNLVAGQYISTDPQSEFARRFHIKPLKNLYRENEEVKRMHTILLVLAFSILFIAAMNYVLIAISSLYKRAKAIGVHKCNGASRGDIFLMFLWETALILVISSVCTVILAVAFREVIQNVLGTPLSSLFTWNTLWVPAITVFILFLLAGVIPGKVFSSIPVTQVFRRYTENKNSWKQPLLFIQFAGISFVFGLLCVTWIQYSYVVHRNVGYNVEAVAFVYNSQIENTDMFKNTLESLPMVEQVGTSTTDLLGGYSGDQVSTESGQFLFVTGWNSIDYNFLPVTGLALTEGRNIQAPGEILVTEEFVRQRRWEGSALGQPVYMYGKRVGTVVGVLKEFSSTSVYGTPRPLLMCADYEGYGDEDVYNVRLKAPYRESLRALNEEILQVFPAYDLIFRLYQDAIEESYTRVRRFRDSVIVASFAILLISLMGLFGYVNDEIRRRSKEIAIRKVNGAEIMDILGLFSRNICWIALSSVTLGTILSYLMGQKWMEQFREHIEVGIPMYIALILVINLLIHIGVIIKSWQIATENPVNSIKAE